MATNNAWNSPIPIPISKGGTNATSMVTTNGVNYFDGTLINTVPNGTAGQVLASAAGLSAPFWASIGESTLIQTIVASNNASINFTTGITSTYNTYMFVYTNVNSSGGGVLRMRISTNGGSSYLTTGYNSGAYEYLTATGGIGAISGTVNDSYVMVGGGTALSTSYGVSGTLFAYGIQTSNNPMVAGNGFKFFFSPSQGGYYDWYGGYNTTTTPVNAFQFTFAVGNVTQGTFSLYGIKH